MTATQQRHRHLACVSTARSPITHMATTHGNEQVVNRETVVTPDGLRHVPVLSGNALRHAVVRNPWARHLVEAWELRGQLTLDQLNFLFHGGQLTEKGGRIKLQQQSDLYRLFPVLRLLGCSLPGQIVPGALQALRGVLVCRENRDRLVSLLPEVEWPQRLRPAVAYLDGYTYYRHDASKTAPDLVSQADAAADYEGMIFAGQSVIAGAVFVHGFTITHCGDLELGGLLHALRRWLAGGATIGGQAARGHGRLDTRWAMPSGLDETQEDDLVAEYCDYVARVKDEAIAFLNDVFIFGGGDAKPARGKRAAKKAAAKKKAR